MPETFLPHARKTSCTLGIWPPASCEAETTKESIKTKTESGKCFCIRVVKSVKSRLILSCPQIWNIEKEKDREKEKIVGQVSEDQRERELALEREREKKLGDTFCWGNNMKFCSDGMLAATRVTENERQWTKKANKNTSDISSIKRVTRKFLEVSRCSRAKERQRIYKKSLLLVQSCFLAN